MKIMLTIETENSDKLILLMRVAEEMGMLVESKSEIDPFTLIAEKALAESWNSPEDTAWDKAYAHLKR